MCYLVQCPTCHKTSWGGCGEHVDSVMKSVPASQRCTCKADSGRKPKAGVFGGLLRR